MERPIRLDGRVRSPYPPGGAGRLASLGLVAGLHRWDQETRVKQGCDDFADFGRWPQARKMPVVEQLSG